MRVTDELTSCVVGSTWPRVQKPGRSSPTEEKAVRLCITTKTGHGSTHWNKRHQGPCLGLEHMTTIESEAIDDTEVTVPVVDDISDEADADESCDGIERPDG